MKQSRFLGKIWLFLQFLKPSKSSSYHHLQLLHNLKQFESLALLHQLKLHYYGKTKLENELNYSFVIWLQMVTVGSVMTMLTLPRITVQDLDLAVIFTLETIKFREVLRSGGQELEKEC